MLCCLTDVSVLDVSCKDNTFTDSYSCWGATLQHPNKTFCILNRNVKRGEYTKKAALFPCGNKGRLIADTVASVDRQRVNSWVWPLSHSVPNFPPPGFQIYTCERMHKPGGKGRFFNAAGGEAGKFWRCMLTSHTRGFTGCCLTPYRDTNVFKSHDSV